MFKGELAIVTEIKNEIMDETLTFLEQDVDHLDYFKIEYDGKSVKIPIDNPDTNDAVQDFLWKLENALKVYEED